MADSFSYKITTESENFSFDFTQVLTPAETISAATCTVILMNGTDSSPSAILSGTPTWATGSKVVSQRIYNGVSECTYRLVMTITTSIGNTYVGVGDLSVYDPSLV